MQFAARFFEIISPILYGIVFAYLLAPLQNFFEYKMLYKLTKKSQKPRVVKMRRIIALILTAIIVLIILASVAFVFVPGIVQSVENLAENLDRYVEDLDSNIENYLNTHLQEGKFWDNIYQQIRKSIGADQDTTLVSAIVKRAGDGIVALFSEDNIRRIFSFGSSVISVLINIILTVIFTVYLLLSKERQAARLRKLLSSMFKKERVENIYRVAYMTDSHVGRYLRMQVVDCILVGLVSFLVYKILDLPYAPLLAVISGITNIIPYFGPFIGGVPNAIFILLAAPDKLLPFIIAIVIIQQIDGNILVPILQSTTMKIDTFWVLVGLTVMGGVFGVPGMILGVPFFAVAYFLIREHAEKRLKAKGLPVDTDAYRVMHHERKQKHPQPPIVKFFNKLKNRKNAENGTPEPDSSPEEDDEEIPTPIYQNVGQESEKKEETVDKKTDEEHREGPAEEPAEEPRVKDDDVIDSGKERVRNAVERVKKRRKGKK